MKKRYTEEQIVTILKEGRASGAVGKVCRKYGVTTATYYSWKKKYSDLTVSDVSRLKTLEEENRQLKKLLAESMLDNDALKALVQKYE